MTMSDVPEWSRTSVRLWTEDDSGDRERERVDAAWQRLFGEKLNSKNAVESYEQDDIFENLHAHGRINGLCCEGAYIDLTLEEAEKYAERLRNKIREETWRLQRVEEGIQKHRPKLTEEELVEVAVLRKYWPNSTLSPEAKALIEKARKAGK